MNPNELKNKIRMGFNKVNTENIDFKRIVWPKMKICSKFTHTQAIQDVDEFVSSSEQI